RVAVLFIIFFFSSRRRHTRLVSDWSSDVCSSDLGVPEAVAKLACILRRNAQAWLIFCFSLTDSFAAFLNSVIRPIPLNKSPQTGFNRRDRFEIDVARKVVHIRVCSGHISWLKRQQVFFRLSTQRIL